MKYLVKYTRRHGHADNKEPRVSFYFEEDGECLFECEILNDTSRIKWMRKNLMEEFKKELQKRHISDYHKLCNISVIIYSVREVEGEIH